MFESTHETNGIYETDKRSGSASGSNRESLPGPGLVQRARQSLINSRNPDQPTNQHSSSAAEKYRRDLQSQ